MLGRHSKNHRFARFLLARIFSAALVVVGVTLITFTLSHIIPADVARLIAGERASEATVAAVRADLGLDRPLPAQYAEYLSGLLRGDLGTSLMTGEPVLDNLLRYLPATAELAIIVLIVAGFLGVAFGVLSAVYRNGWIDQIVRSIAVAGISTPAFWLALLLIYTFYGHLDWLPAGGRISAQYATSNGPTGFLIIDSMSDGNWAKLRDVLAHLALPVITLSFAIQGVYARLVRAAMLEALSQNYVRTARAFGLSRFRVVSYALRNALIPFVTTFGISIASLLGGAVIIEMVFSWPGVGGYAVQAILSMDFPVIMGFTVFVSVLYIVANLLVDICYSLLDPRIRGGSQN